LEEAILAVYSSAEALGLEALARPAARAAADTRDPGALFDLAVAAERAGFPSPAATLLALADALCPGERAVVTEWAGALGQAGHHAEACRVLEARAEVVGGDGFCTYLLAFHALFAGDIARARAAAPRLRAWRSEHAAPLTARIEGMLARARALVGVCPLDSDDLRGWHAVLTGGLLLHRSPLGLEAGMRGRYAYLHDDLSLCAEGINRLSGALAAIGAEPEAVFFLGDDDSRALGLALAAAWGLPGCPFADTPTTPGVIAAYDLSRHGPGTLARLRAPHPGQILWSHVTPWTLELPIAPDLTTLLAQVVRSPWEAPLMVAEDGAMAEAASAEGTPVDIDARVAALLAAAPPPTPAADYRAEADQIEAVARALDALGAPHGPAWCPGAGARRRGWSGGPVHSPRF